MPEEATGAVEVALEYGLRAPAAARRAVRTVLTDCGWEEARIDDAILVVSELVTNAVVHALPPIVLRLHVEASTGTAERLKVHVADGGPSQHPACWAADRAEDEHGRGTAVVTALADSTGTDAPTGPQPLIDHWATIDAA